MRAGVVAVCVGGVVAVAGCAGDDDEGNGTSAGSSMTVATQAELTGSAEAVSSASGDSSSAASTTSTSTATDTSASASSGSSGSTGAGVVMSFFVTSEGNGAAGGDYGGLAGADARCQALAEAAGSSGLTWRAYLSQAAIGGARVVDARDRIGEGPWLNVALDLVATDVQALHADGIDPALMLDELGNAAGKGEPPGPEHDIVTGSNPDGTLAGADRTCANWTSGDAGDRVQVGHHDWSIIPNPITPDQNWSSVHDSPCDEAGMANVLGSGRLYCFAAG